MVQRTGWMLGLAVMTVDRNRLVTSWNPGAERLLGYPPSEMLGRPLTLLIPTQRLPEIEGVLQEAFAGIHTEAQATQLIRKGGGPLDVSLTVTPIQDARQRPAGASLVAMAAGPDAAGPPAGHILADLRATFDNAPVGMAVVDREGRFVQVNRSLSMLLGYPPPELLAARVETFTNASDIGVERVYLDELLAGRIRSYRMEKRFTASGGRDVWVSLSATAIGETVQPDLILLQTEDLSGWKRTEQDLMHLAFHDGLTDLPNRSLLMDRLTQALARSGRRQSSVAVLFIDLDHFKNINDELGHDVGDQFLAEIGSRLRAATRAHDTVARLGGDEFVMLCEDVEDEETARAIGERVVRAVAAPLAFELGEATTTASVGIALATGSEDRPEVLVEHADRAMYRAKSFGGGRYELFNNERPSPAPRLGGVARDLRRAIEKGELRLVYQPQVELGSGRIAGVEALVRWQHPERGVLMPADFIPAAERTGLILELGRWVLTKAVAQAARWRDHSPLTVSVNVATQQLAQGDFGSQVASALSTSGLPPSGLRLEITESAVLDTVRLAPTWAALDILGVRLHVDDFGATPSALRHLKGLPVETVTIDRSVVAGLGSGSEDSAIVEAVIHLADRLHLQSMGEGVETREQALLLSSMGCTLGQGYYFAPPQTAAAVEELVGLQEP